MTKTYLEFSDPDGAEHKFYEVTVDGADLTIRYGRIGTDGQTSTKTFADAAKAQAEADKKLKEKRRKGYEDAVMGVRQRRAIVRRSVAVTRSSTEHDAPIVWRFNSGECAFGIYVDVRAAWIGNDKGQVYALTLDGQVERSMHLPDGVKCLVSDDRWTFAGCDDGQVYDLSGKQPFAAYEAQVDSAILWLDVYRGILGVADQDASIFAFDPESEQLWAHHFGKNDRATSAWMVRVDEGGVYYGHSEGVGKLALPQGQHEWSQPTRGMVLFGWQEGADLYAGTSDDLIQRFTKAGRHVQDYQCDDTVYSCATSPGGEYVFAGDWASAVYCFNQAGERLWKLGTGGCGAALSMQYYQERLYLVTTGGYLVCLDVSPKAIEDAKQGSRPDVRDVKLAATVKAQTPASSLETTSDAGEGIVLRAVKDGSKIRIRPDDSRFKKDWNVQFPRNLREVDAKYVVEALEDAGGFYRVVGEIKKLEG